MFESQMRLPQTASMVEVNDHSVNTLGIDHACKVGTPGFDIHAGHPDHIVGLCLVQKAIICYEERYRSLCLREPMMRIGCSCCDAIFAGWIVRDVRMAVLRIGRCIHWLGSL